MTDVKKDESLGLPTKSSWTVASVQSPVRAYLAQN